MRIFNSSRSSGIVCGVFLFLFGIELLLLFSCGKSEVTDNPLEATGAFDWRRYEGATLTILFNSHPYSEAVMKKTAEFTERTGIALQFSDTPEENYFYKVSTALTSRSGEPDIFMTGAYQIWDYASAGYIEPLDEYIAHESLTAADYNASDFFTGVLGSLRWNLVPGDAVGTGSLWALPMGFELYSLAYNKQLFRSRGISPPKDIEELIETSKSLKEFEGPGTYGVALRGTRNWATIHPGYITTYTNYGAKDIVKQDGKLVSAVNSPEAIAMTEDWVELIKSGGAPTWSTYTWYQAGTDLGARKASMLFDADILSYFQNFPEATQESGNIAWVAAPLPSGVEDDARKSNLWVWSMAMNATSKNKGAAWLFLQYFTNTDYQLWSVSKDKAVNPPRASVFNHPDFQNVVQDAEGYLEAFEKSIDGTSILFTPQPHFFELTTEWAATLQDIVGGRYASVEEGMNALKKKMDKVLADIELP